MTISINSRPFQIMCRDGDEAEVSKLAEDLAARVALLKKTANRAGDSHLLVLAGLMLASELRDMRHEVDAIRDDVSKAGTARTSLNEKMDDMEDAVAAALVLATEKVERLLEPFEEAE
jgi:cell division protein ZapA